jgi:peptide/nickel transport system ATP-binding protein
MEAKPAAGGGPGPLPAFRRFLKLGPGRTGKLLALLALFSVFLPWEGFSYLYCDPTVPECVANPIIAQGGSSLIGMAGGLAALGPAFSAAVSSGVVLTLMITLLAGAALMFFRRWGAFVFLVGAVGFFGAVHGPLSAVGSARLHPVTLTLGAGFIIGVGAAVLYLVPFSRAASLLRVGRVAGQAAQSGARPVVVPPAQGPSEGGGAPRVLLAVRDLTVRFYTFDGVLKALDGVTFDVREREILGIVGETGCGKSVTAKAILRLIPDPPGRITGGEVLFEGINLLDSIESEARIKISARGRAKIKRNRRIARRMEALMRTVRGNEISMIFQEPTAALNPVATIGEQIGETFLTHQVADLCLHVEQTRATSFLQHRFFGLLRKREKLKADLEETFRALSIKRSIQRAAREAGDTAVEASTVAEIGDLERGALSRTLGLRVLEWRIGAWRKVPVLGRGHLMGPIQEEVHRRVVEMLKQVNIPDPEKKSLSYPFELSGGMQQRAMIAMALACRPHLLLADEPTTALDVTIQAQILTLIRNLRDQFGSSVILITHDLGVVAETCERVGVMYAGVMAEIAPVGDVFSRPRHPYTVGLLRSIPEAYARTGKLSIIPGSVPSLLKPPAGCRFHPRCPFASPSCKEVVPQLSPVGPGHFVSCHLYDHPEFFPKDVLASRDSGLDAAWEKAVAQ